MKPRIFSGRFSSAFYLTLLSIAFPLSAQQEVEIHLSEIELQEIFNNPKRSYVYVGRKVSDIAEVMEEVGKLDDNPNSLVNGLVDHIKKGFAIGNYDAVAQALEEAEAVLQRRGNDLGEERASELTRSLNTIIEQVIEEKLNLDAEILSFLKDSIPATEDTNRSHCNPHHHGLRLLVIKEKIDVLGKAKFRDDVKFKDDVIFEDDVIIEGTLSVSDQVIDCDITVGCNIYMNDSITPEIGNIVKAGVPFMSNFGIQNTFLGSNSGNFTVTGDSNTGIGFNTLPLNDSGIANTAVGSRALEENVGGSGNTAVGTNALQSNLADHNTAVGFAALQGNSTGTANVAVGTGALGNNITGSNNTGIGWNSLVLNLDSNNTALGSFALNQNTNGMENTAIGGNAAQQNTIGSFNTAVGRDALQANTTGIGNTAIGQGSLVANVTGSFNTALGANAGSLVTSGDNNIFIANLGGSAAESNTIRIGTVGFQTSCFIQGISGVTTDFAAVPVLVDALGQLGTISSSVTRKHNIRDMEDASAVIYNLRPVTFVFNGDATETERYGLIAEEVDKIFPPLVAKDQNGEPYAVHYETLPVLLLNELQKLAARVAVLEARQ